MSQQEKFVHQSIFGTALINHIANIHNLTALSNKQGDGAIPDVWTVIGEGESGISGGLCGVIHGLFDQVYDRTTIVPKSWYAFEKQYLSPEMRLIESMSSLTTVKGIHDWDPCDTSRDDFHKGRNFWTQKTQLSNFRHCLQELKSRGLVTESTRSYDDCETVGIRIGDKIIDIPTELNDFESMIRETYGGIRYSSDLPRDVQRYGDVVPMIFMIGKTDEPRKKQKTSLKTRYRNLKWNLSSYGRILSNNENSVYKRIKRILKRMYWDLKPREDSAELINKLVKKHTGPTPKNQTVVYVLAEKHGETIVPRFIGRMSAFVLEYAYGSPAGTIQYTDEYMVPQHDLTEDEVNSLDCDSWNWQSHHSGFLYRFPELKQTISRIEKDREKHLNEVLAEFEAMIYSKNMNSEEAVCITTDTLENVFSKEFKLMNEYLFKGNCRYLRDPNRPKKVLPFELDLESGESLADPCIMVSCSEDLQERPEKFMGVRVFYNVVS